jgi:hypothetical protein
MYNRNLIVQYLLAAGADTELPSNDGMTALMFGMLIIHFKLSIIKHFYLNKLLKWETSQSLNN